ncbi:MAG: dCTP deaminase [Candidatus Wallbacteria bacterium]
MSILTRHEIFKAIENDEIKIEPFTQDAIGPASVDLRLDNKFRVFKKLHRVYDVVEEANYEEVTDYIEVKDHFLLLPGESVLGVTMEKITLASNICGWLEGRSRFARLGLAVHVTAGFMQPGIANHQVLEINNSAPIAMALYPGTFICQFIFQRCIGSAKYQGRFSAQVKP